MEETKLSIGQAYMAPTPKGWKIAALILKGIAVAVGVLTLPAVGIIAVPVGITIATLTTAAGEVCKLAVDKGAMAALDAGLDLLNQLPVPTNIEVKQ